MTSAIETAYEKLDKDEKEEVDDLSKELIDGFKDHAEKINRPGHRFGVVMARQLLVKTAIFIERKQSMRKVAYNDVRAEREVQ